MKNTDIEKELAELLSEPAQKPSPRDLRILTGSKGADIINQALYEVGVIDNYVRRLKRLKNKKQITKQEYRGIRDLINSQAKADHQVAFSIIETKEKSTNQHKGHLL